MCYKVPTFDYISQIPFTYNMSCMRYWEGNLIAICSTRNVESSRSNGIYSINVKTGETTLLRAMDYFNVYLADNLSFFTKENDLYFFSSGFDNTIIKYSSGELTDVCKYHYGKLNLRKGFFDVDETDSNQYVERLLELYDCNYSIGGFGGNLKDSVNYSFWCSKSEERYIFYYKVSVVDSNPLVYHIYIPNLVTQVCPDNIYEGWCTQIIDESNVDWGEGQVHTEGVALLIDQALKKQTYDNPIMLCYKFKYEF